MTKIGILDVIQEVCEEEGDIKVSFMHPKRPGHPENSFHINSKIFFKTSKKVQNIINVHEANYRFSNEKRIKFKRQLQNLEE